MDPQQRAQIEDSFDRGSNEMRIDVSIIDLSPGAAGNKELRILKPPLWAGVPSKSKFGKNYRLQEKVYSLELPRSHTHSTPFGIRVRLSMTKPNRVFLCRISVDGFPSYEPVPLVPKKDSTSETIIKHLVLVGNFNQGVGNKLVSHTLCFPPQRLKKVGEELEDNETEYGEILVNIREISGIAIGVNDGAGPPWMDSFYNSYMIRSVLAFDERDEEANIGATQPWEIERLGGRPLEDLRRVEFGERLPLERDVLHHKPEFTGVQYLLKFRYASADTLIRDQVLEESTASLEFPREPFPWPLFDPELDLSLIASEQSTANSGEMTGPILKLLEQMTGKAKTHEETEARKRMKYDEKIQKLRRRYKLWKGVDYHLGTIRVPEDASQQEFNETYIRRMEKIGLRIQDKDFRPDVHPAYILPFLTVPLQMEKRTPTDSHKMRVLLARKLFEAITEDTSSPLDTLELDEQQTRDRDRRIQFVYNLSTYAELANPEDMISISE